MSTGRRAAVCRGVQSIRRHARAHRATALLLSAALLASALVPATVRALGGGDGFRRFLFGAPGTTAPGAAQSYQFKSAIEEGGADTERTMWFTEDYFADPSNAYNPSLATASLCMAMAAFGSNQVYAGTNTYDFTKANVNWLDLFSTRLGFSNVQTNAYFTQKTEANKIGFGMAWKMIAVPDGGGGTKYVPLVAVGVRGGNYMGEWAGNVNVGSSGDHAGFSAAARQVVAGLKAYIEQVGLAGEEIKLWISGFSRAAATSNLAAGYLDQAIVDSDILETIGAELTKDDLYCYTFETPAGALAPNVNAIYEMHGAKYDNIFNLINPNDLVPKVAPYFKDASFIRFGKDLCFPSSITAVNHAGSEAVMKRNFAAFGRGAYLIDDFKNQTIIAIKRVYSEDDVSRPHSAAEFCSRFIEDLARDGVKTRGNFGKNYQAPLAVVLGFFCGSGEEFGGKANQQKFISYLKDHPVWIVASIFWYFCDFDWPGPDIKRAVNYILTTACNDTGVTLTDADKNKLADMIVTILHEVIGDHPADNIKEVNYVISFFKGAKQILQAHDPDVCLAWLMTMDENYGGTLDPETTLNSGEYRTVTITGVETTEVWRATGGGEVKVGTYTPSILTRETRIMLPTDGKYSLRISSPRRTGSYSFNNKVTEYSPAANGIKRVFLYNKDVPTGDLMTQYTQALDAFSAADVKNGVLPGSGLNYQLYFRGAVIDTPFTNRLLPDIRKPGGMDESELVITMDPADRVYAPGDSVSFAVRARGVSLNYQWYRLPAGSDISGWAPVGGATSRVYAFDGATAAMDGDRYACLVSDIFDDYQFSESARLRRNKGGGEAAEEVPNTGDYTPLALLSGMLLLALLGLGLRYALVRRARRGGAENGLQKRRADDGAPAKQDKGETR